MLTCFANNINDKLATKYVTFWWWSFYLTRHAIPFLLALFSNYNFVTIVGICFGEIVLEIAATGHISNAKQLCGYKDHFNYSILAFKSFFVLFIFGVWPCPISCFQRFQLIFFTRPPERGFMKQQSSGGRKIMNGLILYFEHQAIKMHFISWKIKYIFKMK